MGRLSAIFWMGLLMISLDSLTGQDLGIFTDTWNNGVKGNTEFDSESQVYQLSASTGVFTGRPSHFVYRRIKGDFILRVQTNNQNSAMEGPGTLGMAVRKGLESRSPEISASLWGRNNAGLTYIKGADEKSKTADITEEFIQVLQLERRGQNIILSVAGLGRPFKSLAMTTEDLGEEVYVGLFVAPFREGTKTTASFKNVRLIKTPGPDFTPYEDYLGSHIEVMDVFGGHRKIVHTAPNSLQAPNWMLDDHIFTYNADGLLYDYDLRTGESTKINTGFANNNNNDHVHSFDGKLMGISHAPEEEGHSIIYIIPRKGGTPKRVTPLGPSYLHGWSPDGKYLVYTGRREEAWDLYRIAWEGGEEERLTDAPGLDDGSEYAPDGSYIYFNSNRTGTMQIWRMKPDGSQQEQLTFDELNDWFPHISPDGKWMVFISYLPEVPSGSHPFYQQVYIRLMPVNGGDPKIIAYVYGGQGTMNVPNWSPDSKRIAFVSNSDFLNYRQQP